MSQKILSLASLKALTTTQYDDARAAALARVQGRIGEKPTRKQFAREAGSIVTLLDGLAVVVFVAALAISMAHIVQYMTTIAETTYHVSVNAAGIIISRDVYAIIHQIGAVLLAEAAALLFMTAHSMSRSARSARSAWSRPLSIPLALALLAAAFVLHANISSGAFWLVAIMPPAFTLGISFRLEAIIAELLTRRRDLDQRYAAALATWESASADPTTHPDYAGILKQEVWARLMGLTSNKPFVDAPPAFKHAAVRREMERDSWAHDDHAAPVTEFALTGDSDENAQPPSPRRARAALHVTPDPAEIVSPLPSPLTVSPNGSGAHIGGDHA